MINPVQFDIMVVYTDTTANSPTSSATSPFNPNSQFASYNLAYAHFLKTCSRQHLRAAFTTSSDITKSGTFSSYWTYSRNRWKKHLNQCTANFIFDKFSPLTKQIKRQRHFLFSQLHVQSLNSPRITDLFFDKQKTYKHLPNFTIPTVMLKNNQPATITQAISQLQTIISTHPNHADFANHIILKNRFGAGGENIHLIKDVEPYFTIQKILQNNPHISFVIQPFVKFKNTKLYSQDSQYVDTRIIYANDQPFQAYIRLAPPNDFRCNAHQGGSIQKMPLNNIPSKILNQAENIVKTLKAPQSLYALDFIVSDNGNVYLIEGNSKPGIHWDPKNKQDERLSKHLISTIVSMFTQRIESQIPHLKDEHSFVEDILPTVSLTPKA